MSNVATFASVPVIEDDRVIELLPTEAIPMPTLAEALDGISSDSRMDAAKYLAQVIVPFGGE